MRRRLDGVLLLDKPPGLGSNAALQAARRLYRAQKAGHAGTLDPLATGLLPVLFGEATKFSQLALDADKEYLARARLGVTTSTADAEGEILERRPVALPAGGIEPVLAGFRGVIDQVPPMYSALKHEGRPLYALAREGRIVPRAARRVQIYELQLIGRTEDVLDLRVRCSKGTYVRALVEDIGAVLGCGAHLAGLRRVAAGSFHLADSVTLAQLQAARESERDRWLLPVDRLLAGLPRIVLPELQAARFCRGQAIQLQAAPAGHCSVYRAQGGLLGVGEAGAQGMLRPSRLVAQAAGPAQPAEEHPETL